MYPFYIMIEYTSRLFSNKQTVENGEFFYFSNKNPLFYKANQNAIFPHYFLNLNNLLYIEDSNESEHHFWKTVFESIKKDIPISDILSNRTKTIYMEKVLIITPGKHDNGGHAYGNIMNSIYHFLKSDESKEDYSIVVTENLNFSNCLTSIIYQFFEKEKIHFLNEKTSVKFKKCFYVVDFQFRAMEHDKLLINNLKEKIKDIDLSSYKNNICVCKTNTSQSWNNYRCFDNSYAVYFESKGFTIIKPETFDILELFKILYSAKNVILTWGCSAYLNSAFLNETVNYMCISNPGYSNEFPEEVVKNNQHLWKPYKCNKEVYAFNLPYILDNETVNLLDEKIKTLIN